MCVQHVRALRVVRRCRFVAQDRALYFATFRVQMWAGASRVPVQTWAGVISVPVQMWERRAWFSYDLTSAILASESIA